MAFIVQHAHVIASKVVLHCVLLGTLIGEGGRGGGGEGGLRRRSAYMYILCI